jgi:adenylate kinase
MFYIFFFILLFSFKDDLCGKNFVLISSPGSGKGMFCQYMIKNHDYVQICPGDLFRKEIELKTQLGILIAPIVQRGDYVDEEVVCNLVATYIEKAIMEGKHFIIDGFPRSEISLLFLDQLLAKYELKNECCFVQFTLSDELSVERVLARMICMSCFRVYNKISFPPRSSDLCDDCGCCLTLRSADTKEIIDKRLIYFHKHIEPLIDRAESEGYLIKKIDSNCSIEKLEGIYEQLLQN